MKKDIYEYVIDDEVLSLGFKYIALTNKSNDAPYHNLHHMMTVTKYINEAVDYYSDQLKGDRTSMLLAGMFHDVDHSVGKESDSINVKNSIAKFRTFYEANLSKLEGKVDPDLVDSMIKATEYPYAIKDNDLTLHQQIIRDSDLMVIREPDWFQNIMVGLGKELKINDISKIIQVNHGFHKDINMRSKWAKEIYREEWPRKLKLIHKMDKVINS